MIETQNNQKFYYKQVVISNHWEDNELQEEKQIEANLVDLYPEYFELELSGSRVKIDWVINQQKHQSYFYSRNGNLAYTIFYNVGNKNYHLKHIYDYSRGKKRLKEKRFYNSEFRYLKKELLDNEEKLKSIIYYREGIPYYIEHFDESGLLLESSYYHENGLKI